jgi:hemerythrin superfamily protein
MAELSDAIDLLIDDHRYMEVLLDRLDLEDDPHEMRMLFLQVADVLAAHEAAEHAVIFPAAQSAVPSGRRDVHELVGEHEEVNSLLAEMLTIDATSAGFAERASALALELRAHFAAEEEVLFPALRAALEPTELTELATHLRAAKRSAPMFPVA